MTDGADVWAELAAQRGELASFAASLTPGQWQTPSLCTHWRVADVVAHVVVTAEFRVGQHLACAARHGFRLDRMIDRTARRYGTARQADLAHRLEVAATSRRHPPGRTGRHVLADAVVHELDIRRPLEKPRGIPAGRLRLALDTFSATTSLPVGRQRISGLRVIAGDLDWATGEGLEVRGPAVDLLLAITGRPAGLGRLDGPGLPQLRARMPVRPVPTGPQLT